MSKLNLVGEQFTYLTVLRDTGKKYVRRDN